jgi:hypothetical protein
MRATPHLRFVSRLAVLAGSILFTPVATLAEDGWSPFRTNDRPAVERGTRPGERPSPATAEPLSERGRDPGRTEQRSWVSPRAGSVEKSELAPVMAPDASGLPFELWRGLDLATLEGLLAQLDLPPRSPTLHGIWRHLLLSSAAPPAGAERDHFIALRLEALYRSGLLVEMETVLGASPALGPIAETLRARRDIGMGRRDAGCKAIASLLGPASGLPGRLKGEAQLLSGYCAAAAGDGKSAGFAASLAREEGLEAELPLAVLAGFAGGDKPRLALPPRVLLLDYRFLELLGPVNVAQVLDKAEPALLAVLAGDDQPDARTRVAAGERALAINAIAPEALAAIYRRHQLGGAGPADPAAASSEPLLRRALYFQAIEASRASQQRSRFLRAILDDARRTGTSQQVARTVAPLLEGPAQPSEGGWGVEPLVEISLLAGRYDRARRWAEGAGLRHWLALIDVADPQRRTGRLPSLAAIEEVALQGRLDPMALHRLATALDALDIDVPMGLWDAASRTPQPASGYLPETGVLAELAQASRRGDAGRTILLVMRTLGASGPEGANILALGDAIRALKRIGLESEARQLALEALVAAWPRVTG